jgi:SPP1 gp7 family putative phage head morphogenesis protein
MADNKIGDALITKSIDLVRLSVGERGKALALLVRMRRDIRAQLAGSSLDRKGRARLESLLAEVGNIIESYYVKIHEGLDGTLDKLSKHEAIATTKILVDAGVAAHAPGKAVMASLITDRLIDGAPSKEWWSRQSDQVRFNFSQQVRLGIGLSETNDQINARMSGIFDTAARNVSALVHTSVQTVANDARLAVFKENDDVVDGVRWVLTLDGNTCPQCMAYDGSEWDMDGNPIKGTTLPFVNPPLHINCRCLLNPSTKSFKELGLNIEEMQEGTRASEEGPIPSSTTMEEFLGRKSKADQDDMLGKGRADLWREGKITLRDLVDNNGRPLTLAQLVVRHS